MPALGGTGGVIRDYGDPYGEKRRSPNFVASPPYPHTALAALMTAQVFSSIAYSGFNAVLALYFTDWLGFSDGSSTAIVAGFTWVNMCAGALLAGLLNDYMLGNYKTQVWSFALWALGLILMFLTTQPAVVHLLGGRDSPWVVGCAFVSVLGLSALGYGVVNIIQNVMVADQFHGHPSSVIDSSFSTFYFWSNVGSMIGEFTAPVLRAYTSWQITAGLFLASIIVAVGAFVSGTSNYVMVLPRSARQEERLRAVSEKRSLFGLLASDTARDARRVAPILLMFLPLPVFWALFFQQNSTWVFQAKRMQRYLFTFRDTKIVIPPDLMPSLEDVFCLLLIFTLDKIVYPLFVRCGYLPTPLRKIGAGMVCISVSFALSGLVEGLIRLQPEGSVSVAWQIPQIFFMGCAEVLVAIAGIDFAYTQAPERARGVVNAVWGLIQAAGQVLTITVFSVVPTTDESMIFVLFAFAGGCLLTFLLFILLARGYRYVDPEDSRETDDALLSGRYGYDRSTGGLGSYYNGYTQAERSRAIDVAIDDAVADADDRDPYDSGRFSLSKSEHAHLYDPTPRPRARLSTTPGSLTAAYSLLRDDGDDRDTIVAATPPRARQQSREQ